MSVVTTYFLCFSIAMVRFACQPDAQFVLVGTAKDLKLRPRRCEAGAILTFLLSPNGDRLELMHRTPVEEVSICVYRVCHEIFISFPAPSRFPSLSYRL